jgi:hypothetical protein
MIETAAVAAVVSENRRSTMKTSAVAEAMICAFSAIFEVLPARSQRHVESILDAALAGDVIEDADARELLDCLRQAPTVDVILN